MMTKFHALLLTSSAMALVLTGCEGDNVLYETKGQSPQATSTQAPSTSPTPMSPSTSDAKMAKAGSLRPPSDRPVLDENIVDLVEKKYHQLSFSIPQEWIDTPPVSQMRTAEYVLKSAAGSKSVMTVFYFGPNGGGTAASNLARWAEQVDSPTNADPVFYAYAKEELVISEILAKGTLVPTGMGTGPTSPQPDQFLYGIVIEGGPEGLLFLKATGPEAELEALEPALNYLAESIKVSGSGKGQMLPTESGAAY